MAQYLIALHHPDNHDPFAVHDEATQSALDALNGEMIAADVRVFVGCLRPASCSKLLQVNQAGDVTVSDGPYARAAGQVGGFWVLEVASADEALAWGRKAAAVCRVPVEVRPFFVMA
ncbi:YciI family protein [Pseudoduganella rhizocola]|uniref:YciI family protein n=1 Tax=Pseudoduganella rhizocola TaxID=3382643 RepID=UPI0038B42C96